MMSQQAAIDVLNRLLRIICRSLSAYLEEARPWTSGDRPQLQTALARLAADQHVCARRVAQAIGEYGGQPEPGAFPLEFTGLNDAALDYLAAEIVQRLRGDVTALRRCAAELAGDPRARALAEEVLGNAEGHLDILQELVTAEEIR
jgi:hypothetical protein